MDDNSCIMKVIEIVPVDNHSSCSESSDIMLSPCHVKVCNAILLLCCIASSDIAAYCNTRNRMIGLFVCLSV